MGANKLQEEFDLSFCRVFCRDAHRIGMVNAIQIYSLKLGRSYEIWKPFFGRRVLIK